MLYGLDAIYKWLNEARLMDLDSSVMKKFNMNKEQRLNSEY